MRSPLSKRPWLVLLAALAGACGEPASYKVINVPHCQVEGGAARSGFAERVLWAYVSGDSRGTGPLIGDRPLAGIGSADSVPRDQLLLAVVACPATPQSNITTSSSNPANAADGLTADKVPALCPGQQVLHHGTITATDDPAAREKGYAGVLRLPDLAVTCPAGTLARTAAADIEPRPK